MCPGCVSVTSLSPTPLNGAPTPVRGSAISLGTNRCTTAARTRAEVYLGEIYTKLLSEVNTWAKQQEERINVMPGDPSDYWGLLPALASNVASVVSAAVPEAKIPLPILAGAVSEEVVVTKAEAKGEWSDAKASARAASASGVTNVFNSCSPPPSLLALTAKRRRWSSFRRSRLFPSYSRNTRFSSSR